jgi:hypothetical protein
MISEGACDRPIPAADAPKGTVVIDETIIAPIIGMWFEQGALFVRARLPGPLSEQPPHDVTYAIVCNDGTLWSRGRGRVEFPELSEIDALEITVTETVPGKMGV